MTKKTNYKNLARRQAKLHHGREHKRRRRRRGGWTVAIFAFIVMLVVFVALFPTLGDEEPKKDASDLPKQDCSALTPPPRTTPYPTCIRPDADYEAEIVTSDGTITVELLPKAAPETVNNFTSLASAGFYDHTPFHRIANSLSVIQAGDGQCEFGSPTCGQGGPGYKIPDELKGDEKYTVGTVAMANAGPNTGGSQFFIVTGDKAESLPPDYTIFGRVIGGMSVAEEIQNTPVGGETGETPTKEVTIKTVTITPPLKSQEPDALPGDQT